MYFLLKYCFAIKWSSSHSYMFFADGYQWIIYDLLMKMFWIAYCTYDHIQPLFLSCSPTSFSHPTEDEEMKGGATVGDQKMLNSLSLFVMLLHVIGNKGLLMLQQYSISYNCCIVNSFWKIYSNLCLFCYDLALSCTVSVCLNFFLEFCLKVLSKMSVTLSCCLSKTTDFVERNEADSLHK